MKSGATLLFSRVALQDELAKLPLPKHLRGPQELPEPRARVLQGGCAMVWGSALQPVHAPVPGGCRGHLTCPKVRAGGCHG